MIQKKKTRPTTTGTGPRRAVVVSPCERHVYVEVAKRAGHVPVQPVVDLVHVEPVEARQDSNLVSRLERAADSNSYDGAKTKTETNKSRGERNKTTKQSSTKRQINHEANGIKQQNNHQQRQAEDVKTKKQTHVRRTIGAAARTRADT